MSVILDEWESVTNRVGCRTKVLAFEAHVIERIHEKRAHCISSTFNPYVKHGAPLFRLEPSHILRIENARDGR